MTVMNVFRILGDASHTISKCILIWAIHVNQSAEGVSLITQVLYAVVFCSRYLDLLWRHPFLEPYNTFLKIFYISSSCYIVFIMLRVYSRTRERERAWQFGAACFAGSLLLAPFVMLIFQDRDSWGFVEFLWVFSIILESVCVLPQLMLLRQTTVPTVIDSFYLLTLGSYRAFYLGNWIERGITETHEPNPVSVIFGVIQTLLYVDFAWVYWTRQRVKLRNGAVVDSEDLKHGWLVNKIVGAVRTSVDAETPNGGAPQNWGTRGISVSADEDLPGDRSKATNGIARGRTVGGDASTRPEETEGMLSAPDEFEDNDSDIDDTLPRTRPSNADIKGAEI